MNELFFELIRVSVGAQASLSRFPNEMEWNGLYNMSVMHSLVGVCFVGLQRLGADIDGGCSQIGMDEGLFLNWMGMAAQISIKNDIVNQQCVELQSKFSSDGLRSCILKGQGVAYLYGEELRDYRQSGDIDLYVECGRKRALDYFRGQGMDAPDWDYVHMHPKFFEGTEVELHYRVSVARNLITNHRLQKFFEDDKEEFFCAAVELPYGSIVVPSNWMNMFYLMQHAYRHLFTEGIGLRQVMDIYFAIKTLELSKEDRERLKKAIDSFGIERFASGMMWVLLRVFDLSMAVMPWDPDQSEGEFLLAEIMQSGNFGKSDSRFGVASGSRVGKISVALRRSLHFAFRYTNEALAAPLYYVWHFVWKRIALLID